MSTKRTLNPEKNCEFLQAKKQKKETFDCLICLESGLVWPKNETELALHDCRQCHKIICDNCIYDYMRHSIRRAIKYGKPAILECPHCRLTPWFLPKFFIESHGRVYTEDVSFRIYMPGFRFFYVHAIHDGTTIVGYACLQYHEGFFDKERSYHFDDLKDLERFAKPFDELIDHSRKCGIAVLSTEDDLKFLKDQLVKAEIEFETESESVKTKQLEQFIATQLNPF